MGAQLIILDAKAGPKRDRPSCRRHAGAGGVANFPLGEPVSQGKPLGVWLVQYGTNHWSAGRDGPLDKQAETAIRQIGAQAMPICLRRMRTKKSPLKLKLMALLPKPCLARFHWRDVYDYRIQGAYGLIALGEDAKPSVPHLIALLNDQDPDVRYPAVFALRSLGPVAGDAMLALIGCLKDPSSRYNRMLFWVWVRFVNNQNELFLF
jgi:hypothetical protein